MKRFIIFCFLFVFCQLSWAANEDIVITKAIISDTNHSDGGKTRHINVRFADKTNQGRQMWVRVWLSDKFISPVRFVEKLPESLPSKWIDERCDQPIPQKIGECYHYFNNIKLSTKTVIFNYRDVRDSQASKTKWHLVSVNPKLMGETMCPETHIWSQTPTVGGADEFKYGYSSIRKDSNNRTLFQLFVKNQKDHAIPLIVDVYINGLNGERIYLMKDTEVMMKKHSEENSSRGQRIVSSFFPMIPDIEKVTVKISLKNDHKKWRTFTMCTPNFSRDLN